METISNLEFQDGWFHLTVYLELRLILNSNNQTTIRVMFGGLFENIE